MEIKVFACSAYLHSLHLYLFYAKDRAGSDRVVGITHIHGVYHKIIPLHTQYYMAQRVYIGKAICYGKQQL